MPAESIHHFSMSSFVSLARSPIGSMFSKKYCVNDPRLNVDLFGLNFPNPVGLAAGFDKDAQWFDALSKLGFGSIEIGTLTGQAQPGNEKPRLFRLPKDRALLNRMGFNNHGAIAAAKNIPKRKFDGVLGVNIGKSKVVELENANEDYLISFRALFDLAHYFTINVSSPNTPNLRELQDRGRLESLIESLNLENKALAEQHGIEPKPMLLKIAPDLNSDQLKEVIEVCMNQNLSGIIATNTTISRDDLTTDSQEVEKLGAGGISGAPLTIRSCEMVSRIYELSGGDLPIIGVGGIMAPEDAWKMILAGASMVQVYTGFVYGGPGFVASINRFILQKLDELKLDSIREVVGSAVQQR